MEMFQGFLMFSRDLWCQVTPTCSNLEKDSFPVDGRCVWGRR